MNKIKKIIIFVIVGVLVLTAGFVGTLFWLNSKAKAEPDNTKNGQQKLNIISHEISESIVVNITGSNKYLRVKPIIKMKDNTEEDHALLEKLGLVATSGEGSSGKVNDGILRPPFYTVLRSKSLEEIEKPTSHEVIGKEIAKALNDAFHTDTFVNVEFSEFIYQ